MTSSTAAARVRAAARRRRDIERGIPFEWVALEDDFPELSRRQFATLRRHLLQSPLKGFYAALREGAGNETSSHAQRVWSVDSKLARLSEAARVLRDALEHEVAEEAFELRTSFRSLAAEVPALRRAGLHEPWMVYFEVDRPLRQLVRLCDDQARLLDTVQRALPQRRRLKGERRWDRNICLHALEASSRAGLPVECSRGGATSRILRWALQVADRCWGHQVAPRRDMFRLTKRIVTEYLRPAVTRKQSG